MNECWDLARDVAFATGFNLMIDEAKLSVELVPSASFAQQSHGRVLRAETITLHTGMPVPGGLFEP